MEVGDRTIFVTAPGYYEKAKRIRVGSKTTHDVDIILESRHSPVFRPVAQLSPILHTIFENSADEEVAEAMFQRLTHRKKAAALNILAKMDAVKWDGQAVLEFVDRIERFAPDRIHTRHCIRARRDQLGGGKAIHCAGSRGRSADARTAWRSVGPSARGELQDLG